VSFDSTFLDVKNRVGVVALREYVLPFFEFKDAFACAHFGKENLRIKCTLGWLPHSSLLWLIVAKLASAGSVISTADRNFVRAARRKHSVCAVTDCQPFPFFGQRVSLTAS
jgi:hypothetical protein